MNKGDMAGSLTNNDYLISEKDTLVFLFSDD